MSLRHLIFHNFWLKLVSIALATMIWLTIHFGIQNDFKLGQIHSNHLSQELLRLPVSVVTQPGDGRVFSTFPKEVVVTAIGEEAILRKLSRNAVKIYVDLTVFHSHQSTNEEVRAHSPSGVTVTKINPSVVNVEQISP